MTNTRLQKHIAPQYFTMIFVIFSFLAGMLSSCGTVANKVEIELSPAVENPATEELTLVPETEVATEMPTITLATEPTATLKPESTATVIETKTAELENTICSECLLPRAIQKDYEGVYDGITIKYSFAIDKTMLNHFPGTIVDFDLNVKDYPELPELIALDTLKIHYLGWKSDNLNSLISFDDYIEMVKNGGGQYTTIASVDNLSISKAKRVEFKFVTVDPKKRVTYVESMEPNILAQNQSESIWPVQTLEGDFEIRRTGRIMTSLVNYPEHSLGRYWIFKYLNNAMGHFICVDDLEYPKRGLWPSFGIPSQIVEEHAKILIDLFNNERGKNTSPPYFNIDFKNK